MFNTLVRIKERNADQSIPIKVIKKAKGKLPEIEEMLKEVIKGGFQTALWKNKILNFF